MEENAASVKAVLKTILIAVIILIFYTVGGAITVIKN